MKYKYEIYGTNQLTKVYENGMKTPVTGGLMDESIKILNYHLYVQDCQIDVFDKGDRHILYKDVITRLPLDWIELYEQIIILYEQQRKQLNTIRTEPPLIQDEVNNVKNTNHIRITLDNNETTSPKIQSDTTPTMELGIETRSNFQRAISHCRKKWYDLCSFLKL